VRNVSKSTRGGVFSRRQAVFEVGAVSRGTGAASAAAAAGGQGFTAADRLDALVVGAGLIGAAAALGLAGIGLRVGWVIADRADRGERGERGEQPAPMAAPAAGGWDSRIYAVSPGSIDGLARLGAWQHVDAARTCAVLGMQVSGDDGVSQIVFDTRLARRSELAVICEASNLQRALEQALASHGDAVRRIAGTVAEWRDGERQASLRLTSGTLLSAPLVVAADGADSTLRELAGLTVHRRDYLHTGVVANFRCERAHRGVARQWFLGDAVLALLPLPGAERSMVWSCPDAHAHYLLGLAPQALAAEVERVTGGETGTLELTGAARGFPLRLQRVDTPLGHRLALVGDAAHTVHPLAGQGMNLGFGDCFALCDTLAGRGPQSDVGDAGLLRRYARARAEPVALMRLATDGLFRLFSSDLPGVPLLRNRGLDWVDGIGALKRRLISAAMN
jgi:2-polyprenylphenol 6-hydroxylase